MKVYKPPLTLNPFTFLTPLTPTLLYSIKSSVESRLTQAMAKLGSADCSASKILPKSHIYCQNVPQNANCLSSQKSGGQNKY